MSLMALQHVGSRNSWLMASVMLAAALAGCSMPAEPDLRITEPKRIAMTQSFFDHEVRFLAGRADLASGEAARLAEFLSATGAVRGDELVVSPAAKTDPTLTTRRLARLKALLLVAPDRGPKPLAPEAATPPVPAGPTEPVMILLIHHSPVPPQCPDWSVGSIGGSDNTLSSNFGCANAVNLGLMIADPRDLVRGREAGGSDGERAAKAIERYRRGTVEAPAASPGLQITRGAQPVTGDP